MTLTAKQLLIGQLLAWPEVTQQPHRFGGIEFQLKGTEIGHLHGDHLLDLLLPKALRDQLVVSGRAQPHHMYPNSGWVSLYLTLNEDVATAIEIIRFKYDYLVSSQNDEMVNSLD